MISTPNKVLALATETDMASIRQSAIVTRAVFNTAYLRQALELLEKMGCEDVEVELADNQPIFFKPKQYEAPNNTMFTSVVGVAVVDIGVPS